MKHHYICYSKQNNLDGQKLNKVCFSEMCKSLVCCLLNMA